MAKIEDNHLMSTRFLVAIDGPSGAGKGTVARATAAHLRFRHVDTGAMYRAVAWKAQHDGLDLADETAVAAIAARATFDLEEGRVVVDGHDVTRAVRTPAIDVAAAAVARLPAVRDALVRRQRELGASGGVVMEGRDIGTVVFPRADVKIYLDAEPEERARRRAADPAHASGRATGVAEVASALAARDRSDRTRAASPLVPAPDAVRVDTTGLGIDEVVARVLAIVDGKMEKGLNPGP
jgi:cytidylate kinase